MILTYFLCGSLCLYFLFTIYFTIGLHRLKIYKRKDYLPSISIVVAARNEEASLQLLLKSLAEQDYPKEKMEIMIVSDRSTDGSWQIINNFSNLYPFVKGIQLDEKNGDMTPKKYALTCGIKNTSGEIILSTDGDCIVPKGWSRSMVSLFDDNTGIVIGRSSIDISNKSFFNQYQSLDFLGIMAANAGVVGWKKGWSGSGQNIAYTRKAFEKIGGFKPVAKAVSGDDMYLVQSISKHYDIHFNIDQKSFVYTAPALSIKAFINQRIRWASNSRSLWETNLFFLFFLIIAFISNNILIIALWNMELLAILLFLFFIKIISDALVLYTGSIKLNVSFKKIHFIAWSVLQPIYIPLTGVLGLFGWYRWKE